MLTYCVLSCRSWVSKLLCLTTVQYVLVHKINIIFICFSWKQFGWYIGLHSCKILAPSLPTICQYFWKKLGHHFPSGPGAFVGNICINALYTSSAEKSYRIKVVINVLADHLIDMLHDLWNITRVGRRKQSGEIMLSHCCQAVIITNPGARIR